MGNHLISSHTSQRLGCFQDLPRKKSPFGVAEHGITLGKWMMFVGLLVPTCPNATLHFSLLHRNSALFRLNLDTLSPGVPIGWNGLFNKANWVPCSSSPKNWLWWLFVSLQQLRLQRSNGENYGKPTVENQNICLLLSQIWAGNPKIEIYTLVKRIMLFGISGYGGFHSHGGTPLGL